MMSKQEQIERIRQMELRMERAAKAVMELSAALENFEAVQEDIAELERYYGCEEWKQDYADDEAGLLPANLKRGVLSEDGIWNLLSDVSELNKRIPKDITQSNRLSLCFVSVRKEDPGPEKQVFCCLPEPGTYIRG